MNLINELKKLKVKDVCLYGEASLYLCYGLPGTPIRLDYTAPFDALKSLDGRRLTQQPACVDYTFVACKDYPDAQHLTPLDTMCYAIHTKDINTVVEYMLCNLESFDSSEIRKRYAQLYSPLSGMPGTSMQDIICTMPIETYYKNVKNSNIAAYMRTHKLSYAKFCARTPSLCAQLKCKEDNLNWAIAELL